MEQGKKLKTTAASLESIAELWVKIIFAHIRSKKEQEKLAETLNKEAKANE